MGLIKAAVGAIGGTMSDQWKEAIRCEDMNNEVLMMKKTTPNGVISNKSTIIVAPGQCAIIYDNGRVIDGAAEEGVYTFDESSTPSFFAGQFGAVFKEMWQRFTYNGATAKQQAVFFFNIKEIIDNKFGTPAPIPFQDWSHPIPNQMTNTITPLRVEIKCFGKFTFSISNPSLFMSKIAGTAEVYRKSQLIEQLRSEIIGVFQNITNELGTSEYKVPVLEMPSQTDEIKEMMNKKVFDEPIRERGITIQGFIVESVTLTDDSKKKIDDYELSSNSYMQQGRMVGAYSNAVENAAKNSSGAANGFMGIGMMNMASNGVMGGVSTAPWQNTENSSVDLSKEEIQPKKEEGQNKEEEKEIKVENSEWECSCGTKNNGNFCHSCGSAKIKKCSKCNSEIEKGAKFCKECGTKVEE